MGIARTGRSIVAIAAATALLAACGGAGGDAGGSDGEPVTLTWWHNGIDEPLNSYFERVALGFEADHPNVTIENVPDPERGAQGQARRRPGDGGLPGHLPAVGRRADGRAGGRRSPARPDRRRELRARAHRRLGRRVAARGPHVRAAVQHGRGGVLVQPRAVRAGRDREHPDPPGGPGRRGREAPGGGHRAHRRRRGGQVAGRALLVQLRAARLRARHDDRGGRVEELQRPVLREGRGRTWRHSSRRRRSRTASSRPPRSRATRAPRRSWPTALRRWS